MPRTARQTHPVTRRTPPLRATRFAPTAALAIQRALALVRALQAAPLPPQLVAFCLWLESNGA